MRESVLHLVIRANDTKSGTNFGRLRARLCQISFAPCPFPNLAGTLTNIRERAAMLRIEEEFSIYRSHFALQLFFNNVHLKIIFKMSK